MDHYDRDLRAIFGSYAAADASVDARAAADSINLAEFHFLLKQGKRILTLALALALALTLTQALALALALTLTLTLTRQADRRRIDGS